MLPSLDWLLEYFFVYLYFLIFLTPEFWVNFLLELLDVSMGFILGCFLILKIASMVLAQGSFSSRRVRYCKSCKAYVKGFDHHCPAFGNCIGNYNSCQEYTIFLWTNINLVKFFFPCCIVFSLQLVLNLVSTFSYLNGSYTLVDNELYYLDMQDKRTMFSSWFFSLALLSLRLHT